LKHCSNRILLAHKFSLAALALHVLDLAFCEAPLPDNNPPRNTNKVGISELDTWAPVAVIDKNFNTRIPQCGIDTFASVRDCLGA